MSTSWLPSKQKVDSVLQFAMENILEMTASRTSTTNTFEMITESRTANRTRAEELLVTTMSPCSHWQPFQSRVLRTKNKSTTKIQSKDTTCTVSMPCNEGDSARRHPNAIVQIKKTAGIDCSYRERIEWMQRYSHLQQDADKCIVFGVLKQIFAFPKDAHSLKQLFFETTVACPNL